VATAAAWLGWAAAGHGATYLALGDSDAHGDGASDLNTTAYVPLFHNFLKSDVGLGTDLTLINLAEGGETSAILIQQQLPRALQEIRAGQVAMVTITIGGNDLFLGGNIVQNCLGGLTPTCVETIRTTLATFSNNFNTILDELRRAGGAALPIIVMTYPNSFKDPGCVFHDLESLGNIVLEGDASQGLPDGFNDRVRSIAAAHQVAVADLVPGGIFPDRLSADELTEDCEHPNDLGHAIFAQAFISAFLNDARCVASSARSARTSMARRSPRAAPSGSTPT
jgi:lysophospholipase L1-like esterase